MTLIHLRIYLKPNGWTLDQLLDTAYTYVDLQTGQVVYVSVIKFMISKLVHTINYLQDESKHEHYELNRFICYLYSKQLIL